MKTFCTTGTCYVKRLLLQATLIHPTEVLCPSYAPRYLLGKPFQLMEQDNDGPGQRDRPNYFHTCRSFAFSIGDFGPTIYDLGTSENISIKSEVLRRVVGEAKRLVDR